MLRAHLTRAHHTGATVQPIISRSRSLPLPIGLAVGVATLLLQACGATELNSNTDNQVDPAATLVTVGRPLLFAGDTVPVTLQTRNAAGLPLTVGGATVVFSSQGGTSVGAFLPTVDHHDGTYSAAFVGATMGTAVTIASRINGEPVASAPPTLRVVGFTRIVAAGATLVGAQTTTGGFTCGIITTGDMYCWGISWFGIRGNGTTGNMSPGMEPTLVGGGHQWTDVAAGNYFLCGVAEGGRLYCWGDGDVGELGNGLSGNPPDVTTPAPGSGNHTFRAVSIGLSNGACALTVGSAATCWGAGTWGRIGNGSDTLSAVPVAVSGALMFDALSTAPGGTCGVAGGNAYCWGYATLLGAPTPDTCAGGAACAKAPIAVSRGPTFRAIVALDGNVTCATPTGDQPDCWGSRDL